MAVEVAAVTATDRVAANLWLLHLDAPEIAPAARPGQFLLIRCAEPDFPTWDPFLPRPFFVFASDRAAGRLSLLVQRRGKGSAWLCHRREGDRILLHGPIGRELSPARLTKHLLLIGEGVHGTAALALLSTQASIRGLSVTLVENTPADSDGVPPHLLRPDVEYRSTTPESGGLLGALPSLLSWADEVIIAAAPALLETTQSLRRSRLAPFTLHANLPIQAIPLLEPTKAATGGELVPCGTGACGTCTLRTKSGTSLLCQDGPAYPLETLRFDEDDSAI